MKLESLDTFRELIRSQISRGVVDSRHGFHWPSIATVDEYHHATQRTVVLRGMDWPGRKIWCYTDRRTRKVSDLNLQGGESLSWMFFDRHKNLQVRVHGKTSVLVEGAATAYREQIPAKKFRDYVGRMAPGTAIKHPRNADPKTEISAQDMKRNFAVVVTHFESMDALQIHRAGHFRARFVFSPEGSTGEWLAP